MIKAIIIDLDGTTLPRNGHQISEENRVALEEAGQQGVIQHATRRPSGGLHGIFLRGRHHALG